MEWALVLLAGGGAGWYAALRARHHLSARRWRAEQVATARALAEEDVTVFGEQLRRLGDELAGRDLDAVARRDYQVALDAYELAARDSRRLSDTDQVHALFATLASGRYAMTCVRARADGRPPPGARVSCHFNPQHGPAVVDVQWNPPCRGTRLLPACRQCAARVRAHAMPDLLVLRAGSRAVPYWAAASSVAHRAGDGVTAISATGPSVSWIWDTAMSGDSDLGGRISG